MIVMENWRIDFVSMGFIASPCPPDDEPRTKPTYVDSIRYSFLYALSSFPYASVSIDDLPLKM